jgi:hypothetical protein
MKIQIEEINGYNIFGEWTETVWHVQLRNFNQVENEAEDDT